MSTCARTRKNGAPCVAPRFHWPRCVASPAPASCRTHLVAAEVALLGEHMRSHSFGRCPAEQGPEPAAPACHTWGAPVPWSPGLPVLVALAEWQADRCAACGGRRNQLVVDHCHRTGLVRGLLCEVCNVTEGHGDYAAWGAYRLNPPVVILGATVPYRSPFGPARTSLWLPLSGPVPDDPRGAADFLALEALREAEASTGESTAPSIAASYAESLDRHPGYALARTLQPEHEESGA